MSPLPLEADDLDLGLALVAVLRVVLCVVVFVGMQVSSLAS
jgi:hypothetical protein